MRALLTPEVVPRLGVVLFKPGKELMRLFRNGRVLIESEPKSMAGLEAGAVPDARQPLAEDKVLEDFFTSERVIKAAGACQGLNTGFSTTFANASTRTRLPSPRTGHHASSSWCDDALLVLRHPPSRTDHWHAYRAGAPERYRLGY